MAEVISNKSRNFGDPVDTGGEDDRKSRAKERVTLARAENGHNYRDGMREVGNMSDLGNREAINKMEIEQMRGESAIVGDKKMLEFQNSMGIRRRKWMQINTRVHNPLKEKIGPQLMGAEAHRLGQIHGPSVGPSKARLQENNIRPTGKEKNVKPTGSIPHINLRAASKGKLEEKTGVVISSSEETQERERPAVEDRDCQETNSSKDHGRRKSKDTKQVTSRKESHSNMDNAENKEEDEGRYHGAPGKKLITGKSMEKTLSVSIEGGCHQKNADSQGSVRMNLIQKGGTDENSSRSVEMSPGDARFGVEGDDDTRAGRRVMEGDAVLGDFDGTRAEISGRVCHYLREIQEEMKQASGKLLGADRRSGQEWASGRDLGRPKISLPVLGLVYWAAFCPVSSIRALFDGLHLLEHTCSKPKKTDLLSKSLVISPTLSPTFAYPENGQKRNAMNIGEVAELREDDDQEYGYKHMNMHGLGQDCLSNSRFKGFAQDKTSTSIFVHKDREKDPRLFNDKERYYPHLMLYSSTSSLCLDRIPHLGESFGHGGPDETPHATEECVGSQGIAITPLAILPPSSPTRSLCRDLAAVEEREVQQCEDGDKDENRGKELLVEDAMS